MALPLGSITTISSAWLAATQMLPWRSRTMPSAPVMLVGQTSGRDGAWAKAAPIRRDREMSPGAVAGPRAVEAEGGGVAGAANPAGAAPRPGRPRWQDGEDFRPAAIPGGGWSRAHPKQR